MGSKVRTIVPRDKQAASCMADMYGNLTGKARPRRAVSGSTGMFGVIESFPGELTDGGASV